MAVWSAPEKTPAAKVSTQSKAANAQFWSALHSGAYEQLPAVLEGLTAAYLENPSDAETAAHLGFAHVWRVSERARLGQPPATITDHLALSRRYFTEAVRLSPRDARLQGFLSSLELAEGTVHADEKLLRRGYFNLLAAKDAWPEFNLFTAGYSLSRLPHTDPKFAEAVEYQWQTLDLCADEKIDRKQPSFAPYMKLATSEGPKRACWNSWIAPHNFEGFFLSMGDMLVKSGDPKTAQAIYRQAALSKTYEKWAYRPVLEQRIVDANANVEVFRRAKAQDATRVMMVETRFACTACHQN